MMFRILAAAAFAAALSGIAQAQSPQPGTQQNRPAPTVVVPNSPNNPASGRPAGGAQTPGQATLPAGQLIDINNASPSDLEKLKGIGPARSAAIVKGRPYRAKNELVEKGIIPPPVYEDIKDQIIARQGR